MADPSSQMRVLTRIGRSEVLRFGATARLSIRMATAPSEPLSQRLASIREQLKLLADYL